MKYFRRNIALGFLAVMVLAFAAGCSSKGVHMPKHRKRRHCNCPTFAEERSGAKHEGVTTCYLKSLPTSESAIPQQS